MHRRTVIVLSALTAMATAGAVPPATAAATAGAPASTAIAAAPTAAASSASPMVEATTAVLLGGDRVTLRRGADGHTATSLTAGPAAGGPRTVAIYRTPKGSYAIPSVLRGAAGQVLDVSLFDVDRIANAGSQGVRVTITYASTSSPTAVPGVDVDSRSGTTGIGRITPASSAAIAGRLARTPAGDLYAGVTRITAVASPGVTPQFPMHTLTIKATDSTGAPMEFGSAMVMNVEDPARYVGIAWIYRGQAKVSVPAGTYSMLAQLDDPYSPDTRFTARLVLKDGFTVTGPQTVTVDARSATSKLGFAVPRAIEADAGGWSFSLFRQAPEGRGGVGVGLFSFGSADLYVSPTAAPSLGTLTYTATTLLLSPANASPAYTYDLGYDGAGSIPSSLRFVARSTDLTTVAASYYAPVAGSGLPSRILFSPSGDGAGLGVSIAVPQSRLEYVRAAPGWQVAEDYTQSVEDVGGFGYLASGLWSPTPGTRVTARWGQPPLHPRLFEGGSPFSGRTCPACLVGSQVSLLAMPFSDSDPNHFGTMDWMTEEPRTTASWRLSADGTVLAEGTGPLDVVADLPADARRVSADLTTGGRTGGAATASTTRTHWETPVAAATALAPAEWACRIAKPAEDPCRIVPFMSVNYSLPTDLADTVAPGPTRMRISVGHVNAARPIAVRSVSAVVSFDAGATWQPARITDDGAGNYVATFTTPTASSATRPARLKVTATDEVGGRFSETITAAFMIRR